MHRKEILETARDLTCGDRNASYGEPWKNLNDIARLFDAYLLGKYGVQLFITAEDVAWFQVMTKAARTFKASKEDNYVDAAAYAAIAGECREANETLKKTIHDYMTSPNELIDEALASRKER